MSAQINYVEILANSAKYGIMIKLWGHSSVGRAFEWHSKGLGFDSPCLHQNKKNRLNSALFRRFSFMVFNNFYYIFVYFVTTNVTIMPK